VKLHAKQKSGDRGQKSHIPSATVVRPLDKGGLIPLYFQIQRTLMDNIRSGKLSEGYPLPSEEELGRVYQVSRMTARQALHGLKTNGYAVSQKGRGTFVTRPKLEKDITHLHGFTEDMKQLGMKPSSKLLVQTVVSATAELAERLNLEADEPVMRLRRLRLADGIPMALEDSYVPLRQFLGLDKISFAKRSLYSVLRENYGVRFAYADEVIEAFSATRKESELLTIPQKASILSISRVIMTTEEVPIEFACSRYRGDRYRASIRIPTTIIE
jgi:GntR family transcriptional regulator